MKRRGKRPVGVSDPAADTEKAAPKKAKLSSSAPPAGIAVLVGKHQTAKAAVEAGVDREKIVEVAMEDGDVMAWLLATIPEYAREEERVRWLLASPATLSLASLARSRVCASPCLTRRACHTHAIRLCVRRTAVCRRNPMCLIFVGSPQLGLCTFPRDTSGSANRGCRSIVPLGGTTTRR